jgi:hypothetical protein
MAGFVRFLIINLILAAGATIASAQSTCSAESVPPIFRLILGQTPVEVQSLFGRTIKVGNKRKGFYSFFQNFIAKPAPASLNGVRAIYLRFFDGRLYQIEIFFEDTNNRTSIECFISGPGSKFNFPPADWKTSGPRAHLDCGSVSINADTILNPHLEITNEDTRKIVEANLKKTK